MSSWKREMHAACLHRTKVKLREIMSSPVLAVEPTTTVKEALSIMDKRHVRQVMVHAYSAVLGMVTREAIYERLEAISVSSEDAVLQGTPMCIIDTKSITYLKDTSNSRFKCLIVNHRLIQRSLCQNI